MSDVMVCDRCRDRTKEAARAWLVVDGQDFDPADNRASPKTVILDLCLACAITSLQLESRARR